MWYRLSQIIFEIFIRIMFKPNTFGQENIPAPPFIIVSNHTSLLDPPIVGMVFKKYPVNFMAKRELFDMRGIGLWTRNVKCIPVDRENSNRTEGLKITIKRLKAGQVVAMFPEGTRSLDGEFLKAKRGLGFLMAKAKVPVVPVYIDEACRAFPKGEGVRVGTVIDTYIGKPVMPDDPEVVEDMHKKEYEKVTDIVMGRIGAMKEAHIRSVAKCSQSAEGRES